MWPFLFTDVTITQIAGPVTSGKRFRLHMRQDSYSVRLSVPVWVCMCTVKSYESTCPYSLFNTITRAKKMQKLCQEHVHTHTNNTLYIMLVTLHLVVSQGNWQIIRQPASYKVNVPWHKHADTWTTKHKLTHICYWYKCKNTHVLWGMWQILAEGMPHKCHTQ